MARNTRAAAPPLIEMIRPSDAEGALVSLVCSTYGLSLDQPNFFEHDFLPTLLGLGGVRDRGYASPLTLERKLRESFAALVCDAHALVQGGRPSLHMDVLPVGHRTNHAKVVLLHRKRLIRLLITSANLTHEGYRRQREMAVVLDFKPEGGLPPAILRDAVRGWLGVLGDIATEPLRKALHAAEAQAEHWGPGGQLPGGQQLAVVFGGGPVPLWQRLADAWPAGEPLLEWTVCSPFWPDPGGGITPFEAIVSRLGDRGATCAEARLTVLTCADSPGERAQPRFPFGLVGRLRGGGFPVRQGAIVPVRLETLPEEVADGESEDQRPLHAKWVVLRGPQTAVALLGSANFTRKGLGVVNDPGAANIEACVLLSGPASSLNPQDWMPPVVARGVVDWSTCVEGDVTATQEEEQASRWPDFLSRAELELAWGEGPDPGGSLRLFLRPPPRPSFTVRSVTEPSLEGPDIILWASPSADPGPGGTEAPIIVPADTDAVRTILSRRAVLVTWGSLPFSVKFPVNIDERSKSGLPTVLGGRPDEQQLLAYFHGRISEEDLIELLERQAQDRACGGRNPTSEDAERLKQLQNYLLREFVESLFGLTSTLRQALYSPRAFEQVLLGDFSPVRLAEEVLQAFRSGRRSPTAAAFQMVELLRLVALLDLTAGGPRPSEELTALEEVRERGVQRLLAIAAQAAAREDFRAVVSQREFSRFVLASLGRTSARRWVDILGQSNGVGDLVPQPLEDRLP